MPSAAPKVSVVMPVYNGEAYLNEALESVLEQPFTDWELIAVDDGSRDDSAEILARYAAADSRIRVLRNETNVGVSATLNRGWREARGAYIARLDADDIALSERFARQVAFLDGHETVAVVGTNAILIDPQGRRLSSTRLPTRSAAIHSTLLRHNCLNHPSVMLRRAALEEASGYRFDGVEDYDLWLRIAERHDLANLPDTLILYRIHPEQVSLRTVEDKALRIAAVRAAAHARRDSLGDPLAGADELTPELLGCVEIDESELAAEWITSAAVLDDLGRHAEADELVAQASRRLGSSAARAFSAASELRQAEKLRAAGRPAATLLHVLTALRREPRYASRQLGAWLKDRLRGRGPLR
jgi:hypothetical protein